MSDSIFAITMPKLGLSMTEGSVATWHVEPGTEISAGDLIADIETSKITNELEVHVDGVFRRPVVEVGAEVPVGALIGIVVAGDVSDEAIDAFVRDFSPDDADSAGDGEAGDTPGADGTPPASAADGPDDAATASTAPDSMQGSYDRSAVFATHHAHRLAQRLGIDLAKVSGSGRGGRISKRDLEAAIKTASGSPDDGKAQKRAAAAPSGSGSVKTTPAAKRLAAEHGIDLAHVPATGSRGRVSKGDVLNYIGQRESAPRLPVAADRSAEAVTEETLSASRRTIAKRLSESKRNAPHFRLSADVRMDKLLELRRDIASKDSDAGVSINDMLVRCAALALVEHPDVNIQFDGEKIRRYAHADVAVAVALEQGLLTPIVRAADRKSLHDINRELADLVGRARSGKLTPDEVTGGTFTLSNLGMFGVRSFDAIINPPQAIIMAVGSADKRVYVDEDDDMRIGTFATVTLSCDHRVIDGATGAAFLKTFSHLVTHPGRLLL